MEAISSSLGWGSCGRLALLVSMFEICESEVPLHGRPLRRTRGVWPSRLLCRTMRERGSEDDVQPPRVSSSLQDGAGKSSGCEGDSDEYDGSMYYALEALHLKG